MGALDYKTRRHRRNRLAAELAATYGPRRHFRLGQDVGWHWQFDNPLTRVGIPYEWVDTAGTTPTTAVGQGIGLLLGREYGGATGPSLLANGTTGLTGTATAASYSTSTFAGSVSRAGDASNQSWVTWTGLTTSAVHRIRVTNTGATSLDVRNGGVAGTIVASIAAGASTWVHPATTGGSTSITITATSNSTTATFTLGQFAVLPGTHLTQATGTAKPTLSARVNRLLRTEQFSDATWSKAAAGTGVVTVVTDNYGVAPDGTTTAARVQLNKGAGATASDYGVLGQLVTLGATESRKLSIWMKTTDASTKLVALRDVTADVKTVTGTWQEFTITQVGASASGGFQLILRGTYGTSDSADLLVWHPDIRTADDAAKNIPAYQRVGATASDHDTDGFPHYALADGTDDRWQTVGTVDGSAYTEFASVSAITKLSDAALATVFENNLAGTQAVALFAPVVAGNNYRFRSAGSIAPSGDATQSGWAAPITSIVGGRASIPGDLSVLSVDGVDVLTSVADQGTGTYANLAFTVLARAGGASGFFNGRFYGSTGRFGSMSDSERNNLTRWWQKRIGTA